MNKQQNNDDIYTPLTVEEYAQLEGIFPQSVYMRIYRGKLHAKKFNKGRWMIYPDASIPCPLSEIEKKEMEARITFDAVPKIKLMISYDQLDAKLRENISIADIAKELGISRQGLSYLYQRYFEPFMGSGRDRQSDITVRVNEQKMIDKMRNSSRLSYAISEAEKNGFLVSPVPTSVPGVSAPGKIYINQWLCMVHHRDRVYPDDHRYYRVIISRRIMEGTDFLIVVVGSAKKKLMIVPSKMVLDFVGEKVLKVLYIRESEPPMGTNGLPPTIEWAVYENDWAQLR